ncbi:MAG: hypothetical protein GXO75_08635 [Calditrichaeota bacterium]|nr:hypothetical protein [Calditrichota bacterium]
MQIVDDASILPAFFVIQIIPIHPGPTGMRFGNGDPSIAHQYPVRVLCVAQIKIAQPADDDVDVVAAQIFAQLGYQFIATIKAISR